VWVPHDVRDLVVDFVRCWSEKTEINTDEMRVYGELTHLLGRYGNKKKDAVMAGRICWRESKGAT
jgi:hypothetical protein